MASSTFLFFLCGEICCQVENTTITWPSETTTTSSVETTTSSLYCAADKCDRHSLFIYDLEQKVNNLTRGFEILKQENSQLKAENQVLKEDVKELQGIG